MQNMFANGGNLFFKDTINLGELPSYYFGTQELLTEADRAAVLMIQRMKETKFIFKEEVILHFDGVSEESFRFEFIQYIKY
jgi:hypothetical protein